jgi:GNAT superfamily N-acetyltransferase
MVSKRAASSVVYNSRGEGMIVEVSTAKGNVCRDIMVGLPDWFGIPESIEAYARYVERMTMFAYMLDGVPVGFIAIERHYPHAAEACVLGVRRAYHRQGIGQALFGHVIGLLRQQGVKYLTVKTLAEQRANKAYAETRRFYDAMGFVPLEVFPTLWGLKIPA